MPRSWVQRNRRHHQSSLIFPLLLLLLYQQQHQLLMLALLLSSSRLHQHRLHYVMEKFLYCMLNMLRDLIPCYGHTIFYNYGENTFCMLETKCCCIKKKMEKRNKRKSAQLQRKLGERKIRV